MKKIILLVTLTTTLIIASLAQAASYDEATWYITVDVNQVRSKIVPLLPEENKKGHHHFSLRDNMPDEVGEITLYGQSEQEGQLTAVISGQFSQFVLHDYIQGLMAQAGHGEPIQLHETSGYNGAEIEEYQVSKGNDNKSFFSAKINNDLMVISVDESEVKNWVDGRYDRGELSPTGLVSVLVNVESAMAHVGADLNHGHGPFRSQVFQKINQFSASVLDAGTDLQVETALSASDEATAKQIEQVLNGLIAMHALSDLGDKEEALKDLFANLEIDNQGTDIILSSQVSYELFAQMVND